MSLKIVVTTIFLNLCLIDSQVLVGKLPDLSPACLPCEYGYETDADGKSTCTCINPCKKLICPRGTHCERVYQLYCPVLHVCPLYAYACVPDCVTCTLKCPFGLKTVNGKKICECYWPCEDYKCPENTYCKPYELPCRDPPCPWIPRCYPGYNYCTCGGDPHCYTLDHAGEWDNQITCEYIASMSDAAGVPPFTILAKNYKINPGDSVAYVEYVKIWFDNQWTLLERLSSGSLTYLPLSANVIVSVSDLTFETSNGIKVTFGDHYFKIELPYIYSNLTKGWCGNFDGNPINDKFDRTGYAVSNPDQYNMGYLAESWVYDPAQLGTKECATVPHKPITCAPSVSNCDYIYKAPFDKCTASLDPELVAYYHRMCVFDVQHTCSENESCKILASYAAICARNGFYFNWRLATNCPCKCPDPNADCSQQLASCSLPTCKNPGGTCPIDAKIVADLIDVCICKPGYYLLRGICVPRIKCGTSVNIGNA